MTVFSYKMNVHNEANRGVNTGNNSHNRPNKKTELCLWRMSDGDTNNLLNFKCWIKQFKNTSFVKVKNHLADAWIFFAENNRLQPLLEDVEKMIEFRHNVLIVNIFVGECLWINKRLVVMKLD